MNYQRKVETFYMEKVGGLPSLELAGLLVYEEWDELTDLPIIGHEGEEGLKHAELKEMADVLYTLYSYALVRGYDLDRAFLLVHESNMTKERTPSGKVQKGDDYQPPDLSSCIKAVDDA